MVRRKQVCIIGAGVAGLPPQKLSRTRASDDGIERSRDLGGVWEPSRSYPEVQTQSPKELYRYTTRRCPNPIRNGRRGRRSMPI